MRRSMLFVCFCLALTEPILALCVLSPKANLQTKPSADSETSLEAIAYTPLKKVGKKNGWYQVKDVDGKTYWVKEELVTAAFQCAVIKTEFAVLRKGPGLRAPKAGVGMAEKYLSFRLLEERKDGLRLEDGDGDEVWIQKKDVWIQ